MKINWVSALALLTLFAPAAAAEPPAPFALLENPQPLPEISFQNASGEEVSLKQFQGRVVLLNLWATWCVPCRTEMPTLDNLQQGLGGEAFEVVALSIDRGGADQVRRFYDEIGVRHLGVYYDASAKASFTLGALGLPTTILIDRQGREVGRLVGPAEWDEPAMVEFLETFVTQAPRPPDALPYD